jgi:oxygen-independent coproporphyrinogen-3 oxidase
VLTEKIAATDFTGYTIQYPPMFLWGECNRIKKTDEWNILAEDDRPGLYVHIPFCDQKCKFCRYFSQEKIEEEDIGKFLACLEKEARFYSGYFKKRKMHSLYIGGGTPSILNDLQLKTLFRIIGENFEFKDHVQKCIEINPNNSSYEKMRAMKEFGINRLTIGIQTLTPEVLKEMDRKQTDRETICAINWAKELGFENINIDLMAGLPGETMESFKKTMQKVVGFNPDMVHVHPFYPTPYTEFMKEGNVLLSQEMDMRQKMSQTGSDMLRKKGYREIKFDAQGKRESARNVQLSDAIENISSYVGLGPGAVSHIKGKLRYVNCDDVTEYCSALNKGILPVMRKCKLSKHDEMVYYLTSCLRYGRVSKKEFYAYFKIKIEAVFGKVISYLKRRNLILEDENNFYLTSKNIGEYLIYSKYFYGPRLLENAKKALNYNKQPRILNHGEIEYMCL